MNQNNINTLGFTLILLSLSLTACLQKTDEKLIEPSQLNNSDFSVSTPVNEPANRSGDDTQSIQNSPTQNGGFNTQILLDEGFTINNSSLITNSRALTLNFFPPFNANLVKILNGSTCTSGDWIDFVDSTIYSAQSSDLVTLSVQYADYDGRVSQCYTKSISIDEVGPKITFVLLPNGIVEEGQNIELQFLVEDQLSKIQSVVCSMGIISKPCFAGTNQVTLPQMASGAYTFKVEAIDEFNNKSEKSITFEVSSLYKRLSQGFTSTENNKVDVLFVIDNSGSMQYEQESMASRTRNFLNIIQGLDWQIGVTTTDPRSSVSYGDGKLVPFKGLSNTYFLNSSMDQLTAQTALSNTLHRTETGSGEEQGIKVTYRAIERSLAQLGSNTNLIRNNSHLAVVLISDEDESDDEFKNIPSNLINYIHTSFNGQKAFSFHSIITRPGDRACLNDDGYVEGFKYDQISKLTGGVIGDVCATDYASQVEGIANGVRQTLKTISLSCQPIVDSTKNVLVLKDGQPYPGSFSINGFNIVFNENLPGGNYEVQFTCLK